MHGTTRCPYCTTRFKVTETQMEAHSGMVRCGYCRQTFDARPSFEAEEPNPQLELPMPLLEPPVLDEPVSPPPPTLPVLQPMTLAERVEIIDDEDHGEGADMQKPTWPWTAAAVCALMLLIAQAAYFYRVDVAAHHPSLKPALESYCSLLNCEITLPRYADLISIESSELEAVPDIEARIVLHALLRNRAEYAQAYPHLELTLTDSMDKALARRIFKPTEYLPPTERPEAGIRPNRELAIALSLDTTDLKPMGYRMQLLYP